MRRFKKLAVIILDLSHCPIPHAHFSFTAIISLLNILFGSAVVVCAFFNLLFALTQDCKVLNLFRIF